MGRSTDGGMLEGRIADLIKTSEYTPKTSCFLTPAEQRAAFDAARRDGSADRCFFWGGAPECERRAAVFLPDWLTPDETFGGAFDERRERALRELLAEGADSGEVSGAIVPVEISGSAYSELGHRDYLGAITALGLERDAVGDIVITGASSAVVFAIPGAAKLMISELVSVGREQVTVTQAQLPAGFRVEREYEAITDTVMSLRLDGVVRALCKVSREAASDLVEGGDVSLNYMTVVKTDAPVEKGDILSVRGYGKFIFDGDRGVNRRGRLRIDARKYV